MKGFALGLALKQRRKATQRSPNLGTYPHFFFSSYELRAPQGGGLFIPDIYFLPAKHLGKRRRFHFEASRIIYQSEMTFEVKPAADRISQVM